MYFFEHVELISTNAPKNESKACSCICFEKWVFYDEVVNPLKTFNCCYRIRHLPPLGALKPVTPINVVGFTEQFS
ncbi:hypothetical protein GCM10028825_14180 [Spirosoma agri]